MGKDYKAESLSKIMGKNCLVDGKVFVSADSLLLDSYRLGRQILDSDFKPDYLVALWRGGTPVGIAVQEFLTYHGVKTDHIAIRTKRYDNTKVDKANKEIVVDQLEYIVERVVPESRVLFVDDVFDTGLSLQKVLEVLKERARFNTAKDIRIATVYYKPTRNETKGTKLKPDFYIHETDAWIVFPHELGGLSLEEIRSGKGDEMANLFKSS